MSRTRLRSPTAAVLVTAAVLGAAVVAGCADRSDDGAEKEAFCVQFPQRDAAVALRVPSDPTIGTNPEVAKQLMAFGAEGVNKHAPATIKASVDTYVEALRDHQTGTDPLAEGSTRGAVEEINRWLRENCSAPTTTG